MSADFWIGGLFGVLASLSVMTIIASCFAVRDFWSRDDA